MNLFQAGDFVLSSGIKAKWRIECDSLIREDWAGLAAMAAEILPPFSAVTGVPRGGAPFAEALAPYATVGANTLLIAEDVLTSGGSIERWKRILMDDPQTLLPATIIGVCAFARGKCPDWVTPLFQMSVRI